MIYTVIENKLANVDIKASSLYKQKAYFMADFIIAKHNRNHLN